MLSLKCKADKVVEKGLPGWYLYAIVSHAIEVQWSVLGYTAHVPRADSRSCRLNCLTFGAMNLPFRPFFPCVVEQQSVRLCTPSFQIEFLFAFNTLGNFFWPNCE